MQCVNPYHLDATVTKDGPRVSEQGVWQRYRCVRPDGDIHWFQTLTAPDGSVLVSNTPPPECPE
ncbi:MAG: hypothetical protein WAT42_05130, partial [Candidatus Nanopelagicales bacterium]